MGTPSLSGNAVVTNGDFVGAQKNGHVTGKEAVSAARRQTRAPGVFARNDVGVDVQSDAESTSAKTFKATLWTAIPRRTSNPSAAVPVYRRRPFVQVHVCHSGTNLIACEIDATHEGWHRSVLACGSYAGTLAFQQTETSQVQFLDSDIYPQFQNMKLVQSGLYSTANMRGHDAAKDLNPAEALMSTNVLNNYAVGVLHDEVRQMYQGAVYQTGNGFVRPRHLIHLVDAMRQISGPVEVKEVTHTFGSGGFITTWSPDCVAFALDTQKFPLVSHVMQFGARYYGAKAGIAAVSPI